MQRVLITGANRGLGLEMTRQLLVRGSHVWATCRRPSRATQLGELSDLYPRLLSVHRMDLHTDESIQTAGVEIGRNTDSLDVLINNAGILTRGEHLGNLDRTIFQQTFETNVIGPLMLAKHLRPMLEKAEHPKIANISSQLGSIARKQSSGRYSYSTSKAALNMASRILAAELREAGIVVLSIHPGWVRTDMGGAGAPLSVQESAAGVLAVIEQAGTTDTGRFVAWDSQELPW